MTTDTQQDLVPMDDRPTEVGRVEVAPLAHMDPQALISAGIERGLPAETMERLVALAERMEDRAARQAWVDAMNRFQSACPVIPRWKAGAKSQYAPLEYINRRIRPIMDQCGLSWTATTETTPSSVRVTVHVRHRNGHAEPTTSEFPIDAGGSGMSKAHQTGSAISYATRYALCAALGIVTGGEDDDGDAAGASGGLITDEQAANIEALVSEVSDDPARDLARLCQWKKAADVTQIRARDYADVVRKLERRRGGGK